MQTVLNEINYVEASFGQFYKKLYSVLWHFFLILKPGMIPPVY